MAVYEGVYKSLIQGVSQQTPQEREDGQLGEQINMLSDAVTGLRRRGGVKLAAILAGTSTASYLRVTAIAGNTYITAVDTTTGTLRVYDFLGTVLATYTSAYLLAAGKASIRSTVSRDNFFVLNTEKIPSKVLTGGSPMNPKDYGYFSIRSSTFSKSFTVSVTHPNIGGTMSFTVTADATIAAQASPEYIATTFETNMNANATFAAQVTITRVGTTLALALIDKTNPAALNVESSTGTAFVLNSGTSRVASKLDLLGTLPSVLDGYIMTVGQVGASAYYKYNDTKKLWVEVGIYEPPYTISNMPIYWYINNLGIVTITTLTMQPRSAGDDINNPMPKFINYGLTGIGSYQSRLVLLSGSYVNMSRTKDFQEFMRTSVTELLADDAIEVSSTSLSSAQFEYCVPYNKDLVLVAQNQQAVIPSNNTVLTPQNAVIYPSTRVDISLASEPTVVSRSMYYLYQRDANYFQVGEFIPNSYTDAQYYGQNLTDHIPLYATGVATSLAGSSTNNMAVMSADNTGILVNQFLWSGDNRPLMSFHKWLLPLPVVHVHFIQGFLVLFMARPDGNIVMGTVNVQLNQLDDKPIPYLDLYQYVTITGGVGVLPPNLPANFVAVIYDSATARHKEIKYTIDGSNIHCAYNGVVALGQRFTSIFTLTPPFIKDANSNVVAGTGSTLNSLLMEFKNTGTFDVLVKDTNGTSYDAADTTALTWSETSLGYTWVNSIGRVVVPCRTRLSSTVCTVSTDSTTDLNLVSSGFIIRVAQRHRRL